MAARHGKIARLPLEIREQLNVRINNGEPAVNLVPWLNAQPTVQSILLDQFGGAPISEQNVSNWRQGGFLEWAGLEDWRIICTACNEGAAQISASGFTAQDLLVKLTARIAVILDTYEETRAPQFPEIAALNRLVATVLKIHQSDQKDARLALDRERLEFDRENRRALKTAAAETPAPSGEWKVESGKPEASSTVSSAPFSAPRSEKPNAQPIAKPAAARRIPFTKSNAKPLQAQIQPAHFFTASIVNAAISANPARRAA